MRKSTLTALLLTIVLQLSAYTVGDRFTVNSITYEILTMGENATVRTLDVTIPGHVTIPETVRLDADLTAKVTEVNGGWWTNVTSVTIPETVTTIGRYAFQGSKIETLHLPKSVVKFQGEAEDISITASLGSLKTITVAADNPKYAAEDGVLYTKDFKELVYVPRGLEVTENTYNIKSGVEKVWDCAIGGNTQIHKLVIPASVSDFGLYQSTNTYLREINVAEDNTNYCSMDGVLFDKNPIESLLLYPRQKEITTTQIPSGIKRIGDWAFTGTRFESIDLNEVEEIGYCSFHDCNQLKEITLGANLTKTVDGSFQIIQNLENIYVEEGNPRFKSDDGVLYDIENENDIALALFPCKHPCPEGTYTIPDGVKRIPNGSMSDITTIEKLIIPTSVVEISRVNYLTELKEVIFEEPATMPEMRDCFVNCPKLSEVTIPSSATYISGPFTNCGTKIVHVPDGAALQVIGPQYCLYEYFIFDGECNLKEILAGAFENSTLKEFHLPKTVTRINQKAFAGTTDMKTFEVEEPSALTIIEQNAFADSGIESISIPSSITTIERETFRNCNVLKKVVIPAATTNIHPEAFKYCYALSEFEVNADNMTYSSPGGYLCNKDMSTLVIFPPGKGSTHFSLMPPSLTEIGDYAFYTCDKVEKVCIPKKVNKLGKRTFGLCNNLKEIAFLCDEPIHPDNIIQTLNESTFDDGVTTVDDRMADITITVRKDLYDTYTTVEPYKTFYAKFKEIKTTLTADHIDHNGDVVAEDADEYFIIDGKAHLLSTKADVHTYVVSGESVWEELMVNVAGRPYQMVVGDYAFENANPNIKEVVIKNNGSVYIGAMAFANKTERAAENKIKPVKYDIESVFFVGSAAQMSTDVFNFTTNDFNEFSSDQKIYVAKSLFDVATNLYPRYASQIDYRIPFPTLSNSLGTLAREFDVDLSDNNASTTKSGWPNVVAYVGAIDGSNNLKNNYEDDGKIYQIRMSSINEGETAGDGTYVPQYTGVLLKATDGTIPETFYYRIGEDNADEYTDANVMSGTTVKSRTVQPTEDGKQNFLVSGGLLHKMTVARAFPVHKAYLSLPISDLKSNISVQLLFKDRNTTGIEKIVFDNGAINRHKTTGEIYDMQGRRVANPKKGIYVQNGKKIVF